MPTHNANIAEVTDHMQQAGPGRHAWGDGDCDEVGRKVTQQGQRALPTIITLPPVPAPLDLLRLSISAITLMQHGRRSVVEFTLQLVQVAFPKGRVIPEDFGEGRQLPAIDLGLHRP
jgi:hypothetical protein